MSRQTCSILLAVALVLGATAPLAAQGRRGAGTSASHRGHGHRGGHGHGFSHPSGLQQRFQPSGVPVFGLGFDAHHFFVTQPRSALLDGFPRSFDRGFANRHGTLGVSFVPFFAPVGVQPIVIIVQQPLPAQLPVVLQDAYARDPAEVRVPMDDWPRLRIAPDSFPAESPRLPPLTLLVLPGNTIVAVSDYWLHGDTIYFLTSTGEKGAVPFDRLDWEMTTRINAERSVAFLLRSR